MTQCPKRCVGGDVWDLLLAASMAEKGLWPVDGGWLNNTQVCLDGVRFAWGDRNHAKAELAERK